MAQTRRLRILTYMCQDIPCDIFFFIRDVVEDATGLETDVICENRFSGPISSRTDPFLEDLADIVIVHSTDYLKLKEQNHPKVELCKAAPVHVHKESNGRPVYFSDIIIHSANNEKYKSIKDLKGCSWAYSEDTSISGNLVVLSYLRHSEGTNASFFGSIVYSGCHLNSIKMVRDHQVEAAAVDSTVLSSYLREHPEHADKFKSLISLGPLPIYPLLFNSSLPDDIKSKITQCLLTANQSDKWKTKMEELQLEMFAPVTSDHYQLEEQVAHGSLGMEINMAYY